MNPRPLSDPPVEIPHRQELYRQLDGLLPGSGPSQGVEVWVPAAFGMTNRVRSPGPGVVT